MNLLIIRIALYSLALFAIVVNVLANFLRSSPSTLYLYGAVITALIQTAAIALSKTGFVEKLLTLTMRVRPLGAREKARIDPMVRELEMKSGLKGITVYLSPVKEINASAVGRKTVTVNRGLLEKMNDDEVKSILAHEFAHLKHGEAQNLASVLATSFLPLFLINVSLRVLSLFRNANRHTIFFPWPVQLVTLIAFLVVAAFTWANLAIALIAVAIDRRVLTYLTEKESREDEYKADSFAASITSPVTTMRALEIIEKEYGETPQTFFERLLNSHPPLAYRIDRLQELSMRSNSESLFGKAKAA
jgi:Zn-dependent protease with chaperone function